MGKNGPDWASQHLSIFGRCTLPPLVWDYDILTTSRRWKTPLLGQKAETLVLDDLGLNSGLCLWQDYTLSNFLISGLNFFICKMDIMTRLTSPVLKGWQELNPKRPHGARCRDYAPKVGPASFSLFPVQALVSLSYSKQHTRPQIPRDGNRVFFSHQLSNNIQSYFIKVWFLNCILQRYLFQLFTQNWYLIFLIKYFKNYVLFALSISPTA